MDDGHAFFVCHASPDKDGDARPLVGSLERAGASCWLDEGEILPGDSISEAIDRSLVTSEFTRRHVVQQPGLGDGEQVDRGERGDEPTTSGASACTPSCLRTAGRRRRRSSPQSTPRSVASSRRSRRRPEPAPAVPLRAASAHGSPPWGRRSLSGGTPVMRSPTRDRVKSAPWVRHPEAMATARPRPSRDRHPARMALVTACGGRRPPGRPSSPTTHPGAPGSTGREPSCSWQPPSGTATRRRAGRRGQRTWDERLGGPDPGACRTSVRHQTRPVGASRHQDAYVPPDGQHRHPRW
jgi:hypothetical protein